jgi:hypothetical protein
MRGILGFNVTASDSCATHNLARRPGAGRLLALTTKAVLIHSHI